jgi:uncharacterized protein (DUF1499 family)
MAWKYKVGDHVEYETTGNGSHRRLSKIVELLPAMAIAQRDSELVQASMQSKLDRYVVETPRLNRNGQPVKSGATCVMAPTRAFVEARAVLREAV